MGQEHVVQTLQNALRLGPRGERLSCSAGHAGVAKTTIARILAKCLNCIGPDGGCTSPQASRATAASHAGRSKPVRPSMSWKWTRLPTAVSAISRSCANRCSSGRWSRAIKSISWTKRISFRPTLKTLFSRRWKSRRQAWCLSWRRRKRTRFPITIASRCQQFDFDAGRCGRSRSNARAFWRASSRARRCPTDALILVAQAAEGSYRDALSLLDQVLAYKREGYHRVRCSGGARDGGKQNAGHGSRRRSRARLPLLCSPKQTRSTCAARMFGSFSARLGLRLRDLLLISAGASASGGDGASTTSRAL